MWPLCASVEAVAMGLLYASVEVVVVLHTLDVIGQTFFLHSWDQLQLF